MTINAINHPLINELKGIGVLDGTGSTAGVAAAAITAIPNGSVTEAKLGTGAVTADKIGAGAVTNAKLASDVMSLIRMPLSYFQDGKATVAVLAASEHPIMRLMSGYVTLNEVPDAAASTLTVKVTNTTQSVDMTDTLTFTEGTDAVGAIKAFTVVTAAEADEADLTDAISITTAGTTTTDGQVTVVLEFMAIDALSA